MGEWDGLGEQEGPDERGRRTYNAADRRERYWNGPVLPGRKRELHRRASEASLRLMVARGTAAVTFTELSAATGDISSRTLRRHFPSVAAAAYSCTWWLPEPADAIHCILAPRERTGPCWPSDSDDPAVAAADAIAPDDDHFDWPPAEFFTSRGIPDPLHPDTVSPHPLALHHLLADLRRLDLAWAEREGYAPLADALRDLRAAHSELDAWHLRAQHLRAVALGRALGRAFGIDTGPARAAAQAYVTVDEVRAPNDVAADLALFACVPTVRPTLARGAGTPPPTGLRAISLPLRECPPRPRSSRAPGATRIRR